MAEDQTIREYGTITQKDVSVTNKPGYKYQLHLKETNRVEGLREGTQKWLGKLKREFQNEKREVIKPMRLAYFKAAEGIVNSVSARGAELDATTEAALSVVKESMILQYLESQGVAGIPRVARGNNGEAMSQSGYIAEVLANDKTSDLEHGHLMASLAVEKIDGENWAEHRFSNKRELGEAALQAAQILAQVERAGVMHNDIKPDNLMIGRGRQVSVVDFNGAELITDGVITPRWSTTSFASPEKISGANLLGGYGPVEMSSDIFSFALTIADCAGVNVAALVGVNGVMKRDATSFDEELTKAKERGMLNDKMIEFIVINTAAKAENRTQHFEDVVELLKAVNDESISEEGFERASALRSGKKT